MSTDSRCMGVVSPQRLYAQFYKVVLVLLAFLVIYKVRVVSLLLPGPVPIPSRACHGLQATERSSVYQSTREITKA